MINENIFDVIDTKDKAYWLGYLMADGSNIVNKHRITFFLSVKHEYIVDQLCEFLNMNKSEKEYISFTWKKDDKYKGHVSHQVGITIRNYHLSETLASYGFKCPKLENMKLYECGNEELELSFLSGFYDGDGNAKSCYLNSGNNGFLNHIKNKYNLTAEIMKKENEYGMCYILNLGVQFRRRIIVVYPSKIPEKMLLNSDDTGIITNLMLNGMSYEDAKLQSYNRMLDICRNQPKKFEVSKEELEDLIFTQRMPFTQIGKKFGVTDNSIRKRAKRLGIDLNRLKTPTMNPT
jgi:hypothetical protein